MGPIMIDLKTDDGIAVVTIAHGKANALDIDLCKALVECFEELRASVVHAVVITGQGRKFFGGRRPRPGKFRRGRLCSRVPADPEPGV
jgi:enoyl-CoA hydratase/carnithine racemase